MRLGIEAFECCGQATRGAGAVAGSHLVCVITDFQLGEDAAIVAFAAVVVVAERADVGPLSTDELVAAQ